jgi:RHS repeat-associated protein
VSSANRKVSTTESLSGRASTRLRSLPISSSITKNGTPVSLSPQSRIWTTFGCCIVASSRASKRKRSTSDGTETTYGYEPRTERISSILGTRAGTPIQQLSYSYYPNGNLFRRHDHLKDASQEQFTYDALNRVTSRSRGGQIESFTYDPLGGLASKASVGAYTPVPGRPQLVDTAGTNSYDYDANGNQTFRNGPLVPGGSQQITYTSFAMPRTLTPGSSSSLPDVTLEYDAAQSRAVKRAVSPCMGAECPTDTLYYAGDLYTREISNQPGADVEHRYRVFAGSRQIAEITRRGATTQTDYLHHDALGSLNVVSRDNPSFIERQGFDPFGAPSTPYALDDSSVLTGFTGHEHDPESGLVDMGGRVYDPILGRFLTADPIVSAPFWSQGLNLYAYTFNSPLNYTDSSGLAPDSLWEQYKGFWTTEDTSQETAAKYIVTGTAHVLIVGGAAGSVGNIGSFAGFGLLNSAITNGITPDIGPPPEAFVPSHAQKSPSTPPRGTGGGDDAESEWDRRGDRNSGSRPHV